VSARRPFIPDDPHRLPRPLRVLLAAGLAIAILVLAFVCMNLLNSLGVWVTLLLVSVLTASAAGVWLWDARWRGPEPGDGP
jgi:4-amino-4-deoxy-L-arabinose transferase-like glycosyltransferase